jgi:hypothetical protein
MAKKIKPEFFNKVPDREFEPIDNKKPDHHNWQPNQRPMKKALKWIKGVITADNKAGETIHGILDLLPIPNQIIAKAVKSLLAGKTKEGTDELRKLLTVRNGVALTVCIAYFAGFISMEDVRNLLQAIGEFL